MAGLIWMWQTLTGPSDEPHGHAGPSLVEKRRRLIKRRTMMRALLMARR